MRRIHLALALGAGLAIGAIGGWLRPVPELSTQANAGNGQWNLPPAEALERSSAAQFAIARSLRWVGAGHAAADGGPWELRGVLPPEGTILVQSGTPARISRVKIGDILPDGSRLAAVERDAAVLDRDGCRVRHPLYARPADETLSSECANAAPEKETPTP